MRVRAPAPQRYFRRRDALGCKPSARIRMRVRAPAPQRYFRRKDALGCNPSARKKKREEEMKARAKTPGPVV